MENVAVGLHRKSYYPKKGTAPLTREELLELDMAYGWSRIDLMRRFRTSYKNARRTFEAVAHKCGTLPLNNKMVRRQDVLDYLQLRNNKDNVL